jgi:hypothetical protein
MWPNRYRAGRRRGGNHIGGGGMGAGTAVWLNSGGKMTGISLLKEIFGDDHDPLDKRTNNYCTLVGLY